MGSPGDTAGGALPAAAGASRFERTRRAIGFVAAPLAFAAVLLIPFEGLKPEAHRLAGVVAAVIVLWITESIPMPVTAMLGVAACVVLGVAPAKDAFSPFADPIMFLFIGSFMIARAIFVHGLDRRFAFGVLSLRWVGARPGRILLAYGAVTTFISAWISNTATTAMMFPIGLSILGFLYTRSGGGGGALAPRYATGLMLMTSFSASIGGLATPIGTPPNAIGLRFIREQAGAQIPFFQWMVIGVPVVATLYLFLFVYLNLFCRAGVREIPGCSQMLEREHAGLGPWTPGQRSTLAAFLGTTMLWIAPGVVALAAGESSDTYKHLQQVLPEGVAALLGAGLLFLLPGKRGERALTWDEAAQIDWGVVFLYGGGFALGSLATQTGLAPAVGHGLTRWIPIEGGFGLLCLSTLIAALVSELTSNTAAANIVVPVVIAVARAAGVDPLEPALGATMGSSLGFMMPVSTPCNAIVYGSGRIPLSSMMRYGALLDLAGVVVIVVAVKLLGATLR